ncbi:hypothetical protein Psed_2317 [Pseudonocardia dioxanivorans CB1190]|uniref:Uncharacterized protein n=1 Tax=Pseudonocardia dioxanivorans (strain ATCC 55486 / DSM 44775 / JCM 13855 / CB1190) TaxID=675635 RepID=F4CSS5_PSEUX|nr:hypothetical protein Psed_2317 [Pseudonocardia dioxanivorans CB1190]
MPRRVSTQVITGIPLLQTEKLFSRLQIFGKVT